MSINSYICNSDVRYPKDDVVFELLGTLDELNVALGFLSASSLNIIREECISIQKDLFMLSSLVAGNEVSREVIKYWENKAKDISGKTDETRKNLPILNSFILPGGCQEASYLHTARVICRRAERDFVKFVRKKNRYDLLFSQEYLNLLSNYLFVLSRKANDLHNIVDIPWES